MAANKPVTATPPAAPRAAEPQGNYNYLRQPSTPTKQELTMSTLVAANVISEAINTVAKKYLPKLTKDKEEPSLLEQMMDLQSKRDDARKRLREGIKDYAAFNKIIQYKVAQDAEFAKSYKSATEKLVKTIGLKHSMATSDSSITGEKTKSSLQENKATLDSIKANKELSEVMTNAEDKMELQLIKQGNTDLLFNDIIEKEGEIAENQAEGGPLAGGAVLKLLESIDKNIKSLVKGGGSSPARRKKIAGAERAQKQNKDAAAIAAAKFKKESDLAAVSKELAEYAKEIKKVKSQMVKASLAPLIGFVSGVVGGRLARKDKDAAAVAQRRIAEQKKKDTEIKQIAENHNISTEQATAVHALGGPDTKEGKRVLEAQDDSIVGENYETDEEREWAAVEKSQASFGKTLAEKKAGEKSKETKTPKSAPQGKPKIKTERAKPAKSGNQTKDQLDAKKPQDGVGLKPGDIAETEEGVKFEYLGKDEKGEDRWRMLQSEKDRLLGMRVKESKEAMLQQGVDVQKWENLKKESAEDFNKEFIKLSSAEQTKVAKGLLLYESAKEKYSGQLDKWSSADGTVLDAKKMKVVSSSGSNLSPKDIKPAGTNVNLNGTAQEKQQTEAAKDAAATKPSVVQTTTVNNTSGGATPPMMAQAAPLNASPRVKPPEKENSIPR